MDMISLHDIMHVLTILKGSWFCVLVSAHYLSAGGVTAKDLCSIPCHGSIFQQMLNNVHVSDQTQIASCEKHYLQSIAKTKYMGHSCVEIIWLHDSMHWQSFLLQRSQIGVRLVHLTALLGSVAANLSSIPCCGCIFQQLLSNFHNRL